MLSALITIIVPSTKVLKLRLSVTLNSGAESRRMKSYFWLNEDTPIKNLYELVESLHSMGNNVFKRYVNDKKNDFAEWIKTSLNDHELASQLEKTQDKNETEALILTKLLKEQTSEKHILKFICYPLLRDHVKNEKKV